MPLQSTAIISTKLQGPWDPKATYVATLYNLHTGFVVGGPALVDIKENQTCQVAVINNAPFDIQLERNDFVGAIKTLPATPIQPIDTLLVASINRPGRNLTFSWQQLQASILARTSTERPEELFNLLHQHQAILARDSSGSKLQDPRRLHLTEPEGNGVGHSSLHRSPSRTKTYSFH